MGTMVNEVALIFLLILIVITLAIIVLLSLCKVAAKADLIIEYQYTQSLKNKKTNRNNI